MSRRKKERSVHQRIGNRGREQGLAREDAFAAYAMDRLLYRLGRSRHAREFYLKGGLLVANLLQTPHRFTRDIDFLRRKGPPDPEEIRTLFKEIIVISADDGVIFDPRSVRASRAEHDADGYDGIKVHLQAAIGPRDVMVRIDIGFGDAVVPPVARLSLTPFMQDSAPARVLAYDAGPVIAEKTETIIAKFPAISHRLKDILDVVALSEHLAFDGHELSRSIQATFQRRETAYLPSVLDDLCEELSGRRWESDWSSMIRDKAVQRRCDLSATTRSFRDFLQPILITLNAQIPTPARWEPGTGWLGPEGGSWSSR